MPEIREIFTPAPPGSLMRSVVLDAPGIYRIARRDAELYSVQITCAGDWGKARIRNGRGRPIWEQPSTFTGSFWLSAGCEDGIVVEMFAMNAMTLAINWREPNRELI